MIEFKRLSLSVICFAKVNAFFELKDFRDLFIFHLSKNTTFDKK
jgi:hypothetical protein